MLIDSFGCASFGLSEYYTAKMMSISEIHFWFPESQLVSGDLIYFGNFLRCRNLRFYRNRGKKSLGTKRTLATEAANLKLLSHSYLATRKDAIRHWQQASDCFRTLSNVPKHFAVDCFSDGALSLK
jgi:hypothetical protein